MLGPILYIPESAGSKSSGNLVLAIYRAPFKSVPFKSAPDKSVPNKLAPLKLASLKSALSRLAPPKSTPAKLAPLKSTPGSIVYSLPSVPVTFTTHNLHLDSLSLTLFRNLKPFWEDSLLVPNNPTQVSITQIDIRSTPVGTVSVSPSQSKGVSLSIASIYSNISTKPSSSTSTLCTVINSMVGGSSPKLSLS